LLFLFLPGGINYFFKTINISNMGRGDKKTKKGKIAQGSFGKSRPAKPAKAKAAAKKPE
jgi:30S ribosomal protein S31